MARYSYPIFQDDKGELLAVGTSADNVVDLVDEYAGQMSSGSGPAYGTTLNGPALKKRIGEDEKVEVQLVAHDGKRRVSADDVVLKVHKVEVNKLRKYV